MTADSALALVGWWLGAVLLVLAPFLVGGFRARRREDRDRKRRLPWDQRPIRRRRR